MENRTNKTRVITSVMLTAFIFLSIFFFAGKISVKKQLKDEKIKFEASLSDKLQLNKTIDRIKADLISLTKKMMTSINLLLKQTVNYGKKKQLLSG